MAIITVHGCPVEIVEAEQRTRWLVKKPGRRDVYDLAPEKSQIGKGEVESFSIWWVRAKRTGCYPDGSGAKDIGRIIDGRGDVTGRGFIVENELRADDGIREIHDACERLQRASA